MALPDGRPFMSIKKKYRKISFSWENTRDYLESRLNRDKKGVKPVNGKSGFTPGRKQGEFKFNRNHVRVSCEGTETGRIKYYAHSGKILARDSRGTIVAEMEKMEKASAVPAPFMIEELPEEMRYFLLFYLVHAGL